MFLKINCPFNNLFRDANRLEKIFRVFESSEFEFDVKSTHYKIWKPSDNE